MDTLVDECLKIYPNNTAAAYQRAEDEEKGCAEKSKTRSIYLNSVVMCIKRLRNEGKEVNPGAKKAVEFKNTTPNMLTTHLQTLLGKAGTIGSWSIEDKMKNIPELTSEILYKMLLRYVLNEEQLESNGYPIPVNLTKSLEEAKFDQLERTCSRCNKGYQVNVDGHQVVKEDCIFHWSRIRKTRGLRGKINSRLIKKCDKQSLANFFSEFRNFFHRFVLFFHQIILDLFFTKIFIYFFT